MLEFYMYFHSNNCCNVNYFIRVVIISCQWFVHSLFFCIYFVFCYFIPCMKWLCLINFFKKKRSCQWTLDKKVLSPPMRTRWRVKLWVQTPLDACNFMIKKKVFVTFGLLKDISFRSNFIICGPHINKYVTVNFSFLTDKIDLSEWRKVSNTSEHSKAP